MNTLEIGGGDKPEYCKKYSNGVNIDVRAMDTVDVVHDLETLPLPFKDGEFDKVYSQFAFEHLSWRIIRDFVKDVRRILKPGGRVYIVVPNLRKQAEWLARTKDWTLERETCMVFGDLNYEANSHKCSCSPELWQQIFKQAGFKWVHTYPLWLWSTDLVIEAEA